MKQVNFGAYEGFHDTENEDSESYDHEKIESPDGLPSTITVPRKTLHEEQGQYEKTFGKTNKEYNTKDLAKKYAGASLLLNGAGLSQRPDSANVKVGVDARGRDIYSNRQLAASQDPSIGKDSVSYVRETLEPLGTFQPKDSTRWENLTTVASSDNLIHELDKHRGMSDASKFKTAVQNRLELDEDTDFGVLGAYENWGNMSTAQKSLVLNNMVGQSFKLSDGKKIKDAYVTSEVKGVPRLSALQALQLSSEGENVKPLADNWEQIANVHESLESINSVKDIAVTGRSLNLVGVGERNAAVAINDDDLKNIDAVHVPQLGIGALNIKPDAQIPNGYVQFGTSNGRKLIIPKANASTAAAGDSPETAAKNAGAVYARWGKSSEEPDKGKLGGNQTAAGLSELSGSNPYTAGSALFATFYKKGITHTNEESKGNEAIAHVSSHVLGALTTGDPNKKGVDVSKLNLKSGKDGYDSLVKDMRRVFAEQGINNKQIGYQLANQAYAEKRITETEHLGIIKNLDMIFNDDSYGLAQRLLTGRAKGEEIARNRNG